MKNNPLNEIRHQVKHWAKIAYGKQIREADAQALFIWANVFESMPSVVRRKAVKTVLMAWIRATASSTWAALFEAEERDFFGLGQDEIQKEFTFIEEGIAITKTLRLGDWKIPQIEIEKARMQQNIKQARGRLAEFEMACELVVPLLEKNPDWTWRDAVDYLRESGELPS